MELKKTSIDKEHYHWVYLRDDQTAFTSKAKDGHIHEAKWIPEVAPIIDPDTQQVVNEGSPGHFELQKADGHTHKILLQADGDAVPGEKELTEEEKVKMVWALYKEAKGCEDDFRKKAHESLDMYMGNQWDEADRQKLRDQNRACLTINEIEGKIDVLTGYQRQNRYDITYLPVEGGDSRAADMYTFIAKNILEQNNFDYEETEAFEDGAITGRGLLTVYVDNTRNIEGEIKVEALPWDSVYFGPHRKKDGSDAEYMVKASWNSLQKLKELYPEHEDDFSEEKLSNFIDTNESGHDFKGENYDHPDSKQSGFPLPKNEFVDMVKKCYLLVELQKKRYRRIPVIINVHDGYIFDGQFLKADDVSKIKTIPGMNVIQKVAVEMQIYIAARDILLDEDYSDDDTFDVMPFYAKKKGDFVWGKIEPVKDTQREVNKRHSQMVDILNKVATYGFYYDGETFPNIQEEKKFEKNAASPGFVQKVRSLDRKPVKEEGVKFPSEIAQLEELSSAKVREIMNVNQEMMGMGPQSQSGVAIAEKRRQGLIGNEFLFDNFSLTRRMVGRRLFRKIQETYSPERIMRIINNKVNQGKDVKIGDKNPGEYSEEELIQILGEVDADKYDVVVAESAFSPTKRTTNFIVWSELAKQGIPVPPDMLVEMSDLPNKEEMKARMKQDQEQAAKLEQDKMNTEIQKTLIAKGQQPGGQ